MVAFHTGAGSVAGAVAHSATVAPTSPAEKHAPQKSGPRLYTLISTTAADDHGKASVSVWGAPPPPLLQLTAELQKLPGARDGG